MESMAVLWGRERFVAFHVWTYSIGICTTTQPPRFTGEGQSVYTQDHHDLMVGTKALGSPSLDPKETFAESDISPAATVPGNNI